MHWSSRHACFRRRPSVWRWVESQDALRTYGTFFSFLLLGEVPFLRVHLRSLTTVLTLTFCTAMAWTLRASCSGLGSSCCRSACEHLLSRRPLLRHWSVWPPQELRFADMPYFVGLATMTIYIGAHRGLTTKLRQQISLREVTQRTSL